MIFDKPIAFAEAIASRAVKSALPTELGSRELSSLAPELRERAMFSARTTNAGYLEKINSLITDLVDGKTDQATVRLRLQEGLQEFDYQPSVDERGTLRDLSSDARLNLIIETNARQAQGYGYWQQGQDEDLLFAFPAQELFRAESRKVERDWSRRWQEAGGEFFDGGRMIALKDDSIWTEISAFGTPYPPFDFNSGMDVRDISRREAIALGVIDAQEKVAPQDRGFDDDLEVEAPERQGALFDALVESVGDAFELVKGVLRRKAA